MKSLRSYFSYNPILLLLAFLISVALVGVLVVTAQKLTNETIDQAAKVVNLQYEKLNNLLNLHIAGQNRTVNLSLALLQDDPFEQDAFLTQFHQNGLNYTMHRDALAQLITQDKREQHWLNQLNQMAKVTGPLQNSIANEAINGNKAKGIELLTQQVIPQLNAFSQKVNDFSGYQAEETKKLIDQAKLQVDKIMKEMMLLAFAIVAISLFIAFIIARKLIFMNTQLKTTNERLEEQVTSRTLSLSKTQEILLEKNKILEELSITDPLTQLYNRLKIESLLEQHHQLFLSQHQPYSVLLIDIDFFKAINDSQGHAQGDQVLIEMSVCLKLFFTENAHLARWGGEEFVVLLENYNLTKAKALAEQFRQLVENHQYSKLDSNLTISIGVASIQMNESIIDLIHRADMALYTAKHQGRNQVCSDSRQTTLAL